MRTFWAGNVGLRCANPTYGLPNHRFPSLRRSVKFPCRVSRGGLKCDGCFATLLIVSLRWAPWSVQDTCRHAKQRAEWALRRRLRRSSPWSVLNRLPRGAVTGMGTPRGRCLPDYSAFRTRVRLSVSVPTGPERAPSCCFRRANTCQSTNTTSAPASSSTRRSSTAARRTGSRSPRRWPSSA